MDVIYFEDWTIAELRKERKSIEKQILTAVASVSYAGGSSTPITQAEAKALVRLLSARIAELDGRKPRRNGMRFLGLVSRGA
ncbi:hypothetical protein [Pararhizobium sp.]|uniref:hypothetical protein n=1 Tax=Pararhizobium sp. TaxID=1977563 RepID=UPI003D0ABF1C